LPRVKYLEIIADNLSKAGYSWGCVSAVDCEGRTIWIADAHRNNGKQFVVRADELSNRSEFLATRLTWGQPESPLQVPETQSAFRLQEQRNVFRRGERASAKKCLDIDYMLRVKRHPTEA
jgi:hypothetical protein